MSIPEDIRIAETVTAESSAHLSDVLREASETGRAVLPVGGGSCLSTGNPVDHGFVAIDLSRLSGVDDYIATDMTASFQAGTPVQEIKRVLAENGQMLPLNLPDDDPGTIGGLVSTGFAGSERLGRGTLKDMIIGCEYVRGDGLLAKAGGMTVKNVSGFEMSRLLHGSWGSLAVLTRINMKVVPQPQAVATVAWRSGNLHEELARQRQLLESFPMAVCLESGTPEAWTRISFEGRSVAVEEYVSSARDQFASNVSVSVTPPTSSRDRATLVVHGTVTELMELGPRLEKFGDLRISLGTGTLRLVFDTSLHSFEQITKDLPGTWRIEGGPADWKRGCNVWGPPRQSDSIAQSIKTVFDPANILNRGRLFV